MDGMGFRELLNKIQSQRVEIRESVREARESLRVQRTPVRSFLKRKIENRKNRPKFFND